MKFKIDFEGVEDLKINKLEISSCKKEKLKKENTIQNDRINLEENVPWDGSCFFRKIYLIFYQI